MSSVNTFDLYKLNMSKDMPVLRRHYDRTKHELKTKRERLAQLEREWDSLHALNSRDDNFRGSQSVSDRSAVMRSTILTADMGTERKDEYVNLDQLKSHILLQRSKLHHAQQKVKEVRLEKATLIEMYKKTREQIDADYKELTKLRTQVEGMEKLVMQVDSVRHLEAGRRVTVGGMGANQRFIIERERQSWLNNFQIRIDRLHFEERETKEYLRRYLEHLKVMKQLKLDLEVIAEAKREHEVKQKEFMVTLQKRTREFECVRFLYGLYELSKVLDRKEALVQNSLEENKRKKKAIDVSLRDFEQEEIELESQSREVVREFKVLMKMNRLFPVGLMSTQRGSNADQHSMRKRDSQQNVHKSQSLISGQSMGDLEDNFGSVETLGNTALMDNNLSRQLQESFDHSTSNIYRSQRGIAG